MSVALVGVVVLGLARMRRWGAVSIQDQLTVRAEEGRVNFTIHSVGRITMSPESAVQLALRLLDAANEIEPGSGGFVWPPKDAP